MRIHRAYLRHSIRKSLRLFNTLPTADEVFCVALPLARFLANISMNMNEYLTTEETK